MATIHPYPHLWNVRVYLWELQKELLQTLKSEFDHRLKRESTPSEWFQALTTSPEYSWIKDLTTLMAEIDVCTELEQIHPEDESAARYAIENLFFNGNEKTFYASYFQALPKGMNLLPLHNHLKAAVSHLPVVEMSSDVYKAKRNEWHERHRLQAKSKRN